jgi:uncharacterized protein YcfJ
MEPGTTKKVWRLTMIRTMIRTKIRTTMTALALGFFALTGASAMAASNTAHRHGKTAIVAQADSATTTPASDATKTPKKTAKKTKATKAAKDKSAAADGATPAPAPEKMPEKK